VREASAEVSSKFSRGDGAAEATYSGSDTECSPAGEGLWRPHAPNTCLAHKSRTLLISPALARHGRPARAHERIVSTRPSLCGAKPNEWSRATLRENDVARPPVSQAFVAHTASRRRAGCLVAGLLVRFRITLGGDADLRRDPSENGEGQTDSDG